MNGDVNRRGAKTSQRFGLVKSFLALNAHLARKSPPAAQPDYLTFPYFVLSTRPQSP